MMAGVAPREMRLGRLDFVLAGVGSITAVHSVGMSLGRPQLGYVFVALIAFGTLVSLIVNQRTKGQVHPVLSGFLYVAAALASFFAAPALNPILPDEGFPRELVYAGVLCWMAAFGSWVAWRDGVLLFQAIPSIALYGLVGAFSTFDGAEFLFFIFLLCCATLYARAHQRTMMARAAESGYRQLGEIRSGPWRWMAGPEWALASAFVVVVLSILGAPVIQQSVQQVAGAVRIVPPRMPQQPRSNLGSGTDNSQMRIGQGPRQLSERVVFRVEMDQPRYLKTGTFNAYSGEGWTRSAMDGRRAEAFQALERDMARLLENGRYETLQYRFVNNGGWLGTLPVPGFPREIRPAGNLGVNFDGSVSAFNGLSPTARYSATVSVLRDEQDVPANTGVQPDFLWPYLEPGQTSMQVANLADQVTRGLESDIEKARAIKREIESRTRYNLNAPPTPRGADPVDYFLFGPVREGYCDLFASAMVLMARSQGIPARVAVGYFPVSRQRDEDGLWLVREADAHAWAELYFPGVGWVVFDPTEGAPQAENGEVGAPTQRPGLADQPWFGLVRDGGIALVVLIGSLILYRIYRKRQEFLNTPAELTNTAYMRFIGALERASDRPKRLAESPAEYLRAVEGHLNGTTDQAKRLVRDFEAAFYAPEGADMPVENLVSEVATFEKALTAHAKEQRKSHNRRDANPPASRV